MSSFSDEEMSKIFQPIKFKINIELWGHSDDYYNGFYITIDKDNEEIWESPRYESLDMEDTQKARKDLLEICEKLNINLDSELISSGSYWDWKDNFNKINQCGGFTVGSKK